MAAAGAILLGGSPVEAVAATLGARLPDRIEVIGLPHRGISHWPWPWVFAVWSMWAQHTAWGDVMAWWLAGALFHIGADLFTVGGIPLLLPNWRMRFGALRTGSFAEYLVVAFFVLAAAMQILHLRIVPAEPPAILIESQEPQVERVGEEGSSLRVEHWQLTAEN
jgi:membrane-bound metal-dependent hydrolase YbcI (DUF457 family)